MKKRAINAPNGYAALLSTLIISTLLSIIVFAASTSTFLARFDVLDHTSHLQAQHYAVSCIYVALFSFTRDHEYQPPTEGQIVHIDSTDSDGTCKIEKVHKNGETVLIRTSASVRGMSSTFEAAIVSTSTSAVPVLRSWKEIYPF